MKPTMIRAVIVEDEPLAARYLQALLLETGKVEVCGIAWESETGLFLCSEQSPEAVFLDIRLPGPDGLTLAAHLRLLPTPPLIVFTTGQADRASDAFRLEAVDYLLKPLDPEQVFEALHRLQSRLATRDQQPLADRETSLSSKTDRLPVKNSQDDIVRLIPCWEIVAVLRHHRRTWIHTATNEYPTYYTLS